MQKGDLESFPSSQAYSSYYENNEVSSRRSITAVLSFNVHCPLSNQEAPHDACVTIGCFGFVRSCQSREGNESASKCVAMTYALLRLHMDRMTRYPSDERKGLIHDIESMVGQRFGLHSVKSPRMWELILSTDAFSSPFVGNTSWSLGNSRSGRGKNLDYYPPKRTEGKSLADTSVEKGVRRHPGGGQ